MSYRDMTFAQAISAPAIRSSPERRLLYDYLYRRRLVNVTQGMRKPGTFHEQ